MGEETGTPTPVNSMLTQLIRVKERVGKRQVLPESGRRADDTA